ncbi:MAG: glycosyltransferase [Candidatus Rokuibacteriota bacterium]
MAQTSIAATLTRSAEVDEQVAALGPRDIAVALLTYNNAETVKNVIATAALGLERHFPGATAAVINADAGSSDGTRELLAEAGLPAIRIQHMAPPDERVTVPFHGVPGRSAALRATFDVAHRLGARVLVVLEADLTSMTDEWMARLAGPVLEKQADFVSPVYARHRYEGTIPSLLMSPLVRALYGRRVRRPLGGQQALSARLLEHLLIHPKWQWSGRDISDLWVLGTAVADGFSVWEAWLGRRTIRSATRTVDLPTMVVQTLGSAFTLMDRHEELWLEVRGSEPLPEIGQPSPVSVEPTDVDVERMRDGFRRGLRDLTPVWEHVLAPETLGDVLSLETAPGPFAFPDNLWARIVYDFALGHHYGVIHGDHLLRSLVPLYLGRTAAFVIVTQRRSAEASEGLLEGVAAAFERQKAYLVERWRTI